MAIEIERKFLIKHDGWREHADGGRYLSQGYLTNNEPCSVRIRLIDTCQGWISVKAALSGMSRTEYEYEIPAPDAKVMLDTLCGPVVAKRRYHVLYAGWLWEVDEFLGQNQGLVVAEIELTHEAAVFDRPDWLGDEVTLDKRYYNNLLAQHPYGEWS